jgi:hypothetical protein
MMNPDAHYKVRDGRLLVNSESIALPKGLIYAALARAGCRAGGPVRAGEQKKSRSRNCGMSYRGMPY